MPVIARPHSFLSPHEVRVPPGCSLQDIVTLVVGENGEAIVQLEGEPIPREMWRFVRPKEHANVILTIPLHGGDNFVNQLLTVAVVVASSYFLGPGAGSAVISGTGAGATFGNALIAATVATAGVAAVNALFPIRLPTATRTEDSPTYGIAGSRNDARPFGTVPVVLGIHRHTPPLAARSYTELAGHSKEFLRMMVAWGYGPLAISDIRIGNTPISEFGIPGHDIETQSGTVADGTSTPYFSSVVQETVGVELVRDADWIVRTSETQADEVALDFFWPAGLQRITKTKGNRVALDAQIEIQTRPAGDPSWGASQFLNVSRNTTSAVRESVRIFPHGAEQIDVRCRMTLINWGWDEADTLIKTAVWASLKTARRGKPVEFRAPLAITALRIQATDRLAGLIDNLNGLVASIVPVWSEGHGWSTQAPSNNPAALYRHVLLGPANARPRTEAQVDDTALAEWFAFCEAEGYAYNRIHDFQQSVWDTLADIASAGRAAPTIRDGVWSVIVDTPDKPVVQHFTPRNSWGFQSSKMLTIQPHAWRVRFANEDQGYRADERIVYDDGFDAGNATNFETVEFPGITDPDLAWKFGRYHIAQSRLRPEEYSFFADFEHLACQRGDVIRVSHDVTLWGSGAGRVKSIEVDSEGDTVAVTLDEQMAIEASKSYNLRFRLADGSSLPCNIVTVGPALTYTVDIAPIATGDGPQPGDLAMFGETGVESVRLIVKRIERAQELTARLVCVDEAPQIYDADTGPIPPFDSVITDPVDVTRFPPPVPQIINIESGAFALLRTSTGFTPRILVAILLQETLVPVREWEIRFRQENGEWEVMAHSASQQTAALAPVEQDETYEIQVRSISVFGVASEWSDPEFETVVGDAEPPPDVSFLELEQVKYGVKLRWEPVQWPTLRDYEVRVGADWESAEVLTRVDASSWLWEFQQAGSYTIWVAAVTYADNYSDNPISETIEIHGPEAVLLSWHFDGPDVVLEWTASESVFAVEEYEVEALSEIYTVAKATSFRLRATWVNTRTITVTAIDVAGNRSASASVDVLVVPPTAVRNLTAQVIDNNVLLNWIGPATHSLPIAFYRVLKGDEFDAADEVGEVGGTFSPLFETESGEFRYWIVPVDTAGNVGDEASIIADVKAPPDYVLRANDALDPELGDLRLACVINGTLYAPADACEETWAEHFTNNGWTTIQQQIDAGYPLYLQPTPEIDSDGCYWEKEIDYGAVLPPTVVALTLDKFLMDGSVTVTPTISYRSSTDDPWEELEAGQRQVFAPGFRFIRVRLDFDAADQASLLRLDEIRVRLDVKMRTDAGVFEVTSTEGDGDFVEFGVEFIDVVSITVTPKGTTPRYAIYNFDDSPYPDGFDVYLFDLDGNRIAGTVSWTVRGV